MRQHKNRRTSRTFSAGFWTQLSPDLKDEFFALPPEERLALGPKIVAIARSLGLTDDPEVALALVSEDEKYVACQARKLHKTVCKLRLFYNRLADLLREGRLHRQLHGCQSANRYLSHVDSRLGMPASSFKAAADSGQGYRLHAAELKQGVEGEDGVYEDGVDEDFIAANLTKLSFYGDVRARVGAMLALKAFKELPVASFRRYRDRDDFCVTNTVEIAQARLDAAQAEKPQKASRGIKIKSLEEFPGRTPIEREARRIVSRNGIAFPVAASSLEILDAARERLTRYRSEIDNSNYDKFRADPPTVLLAKILGDDTINIKTALEAEDQIRGAIGDMAASRYTLSILVTRLCDEPFFIPRWHSQNNSFANYARSNLGIREELRDLLRVGRNLYKYPYFLGGDEGLATENVFLSLRYLDDAMKTHHGDVSLIRNHIRHLSVREFAAFAKDPHFDERGDTKALGKRQEDSVFGILGQISHFASEGKEVAVLELYDENEGSKLRGWISELESAASRSLNDQTLFEPEPEENADQSASYFDEDNYTLPTESVTDEELSTEDLQEMIEAAKLEMILEAIDRLDDMAA